MFNLLSLLDDIAATLDDVSIMTKTAIEKTSVLMSDDLAVNAGVVTGTTSERELPIVKAIFLGSLLNKVYSIGGVLALMAIYPPILKVILFGGGCYLAFEGVHKIVEKLFHKKAKKGEKKPISEENKIKGAVRTDLVLSIEIILIAKESITGPYMQQVIALILVGLAASIIIYGLVAILVKIDDFGLHLVKKDQKTLGMMLVNSMPYTMKALGIIGTIAMLLVGGEIITHTFHIPYYMPQLIQHVLMAIVAGGIILIPVEFILKKKAV